MRRTVRQRQQLQRRDALFLAPVGGTRYRIDAVMRRQQFYVTNINHNCTKVLVDSTVVVSASMIRAPPIRWRCRQGRAVAVTALPVRTPLPQGGSPPQEGDRPPCAE